MITTPTLILDEVKCKRNITNMFHKSQKHGVMLRPHFKTHQSLEIGSWFKEVGVSKITVSSLQMASYFAQDWDDITVAFPINILEIDTINELAKKINLNILVESDDSIDYLQKHLKHSVNFYIKINIGNNRAGFVHYDIEGIENLLHVAKGSDKLNFIGFLGHAGHTYKCRGKAAILSAHEEAKNKLVNLKNQFKDRYPNIIASYGDTPSCSVAENFEGLDELRPGNYVFYDLVQTQIGSCYIEDIAVALECPIVGVHKKQSELIIYGGGIHLSKDRMIDKEYGTIFGKLTKKTTNGWDDLIPNTYLRGISQEHGVVKVPEDTIENYKVGDTVLVFPVHSCMTADLLKRLQTINGDQVTMMQHTF